MNKRIAIVWVSLTLLQTSVAHGIESHHARIETVEGAKTVLLQHDLALREASPGEEIEIGERVRTDDKTTVTISYEDGSHLTILPNTDLEIEEPKNKVQSNQLRSGTVKGSIEKAKSSATEMGQPSGKPPIKFVIRTRTAVMGVRGTEFVAGFNAASGMAQFNTLEGTVEVASSPAQLMGGTGVAVQSGQFVSATAESGLSAVTSFDRGSFLGNLVSAARSAASGVASAASSSSGSSASAEVRAPLPVPAAPPPKLPQAPPPPPAPPAVVQQKLVEAEQDRPHMHLLAFALGAFMSQNPNSETVTGIPYYRAFQVTWTPIIPLPVLNFLYVRGSFGATMFEDYSLNNAFLVHEYQAFAGTSLLSPLFVEAGGGEQIWRNDGIQGGIASANAGLIISQNGRWNRIYVGASKFMNGTKPVEVHAGVGIQFF